MQVKVIDKRREKIEVRVDSEEDLWTLKTIMRPGDRIRARTLREVQMGGSGRKERKPIVVTLRAKSVEFQPFTGKLRVFGVIEEGPEEYGLKGKHHSLIISPGMTVTLERSGGWSNRDLKKLGESGPKGKAVIAAVDYDEYGIALLAPYGFKMLHEKDLKLPGKDDPSREDLIERVKAEIASEIIKAASSNEAKIVLIAGPGRLKHDIADRVKASAPGLTVVTDDASMGGRAGVEEILRRPKIIETLREYTIAEAEHVLEEFLKNAVKNPENVAMGPRDVAATAMAGAVDSVIVLDELLHDIDDEVRSLVDEALAEVDKYRGKIYIIPADSPIGEKVKRLGGIIAVLRYPMPQHARSLDR